MTRLAFACYAAGATSAACAILTAEVALWIPTGLLVFVATFLYAVADSLRDAAYARERAARPPGPNEPHVRPCCAFWAASGTVHGNLCRNAPALVGSKERTS